MAVRCKRERGGVKWRKDLGDWLLGNSMISSSKGGNMKENPRWNHLFMRKYSKTDQSFVSTCTQPANQLMVKDPIHPEESSRIPKISFAAAEPPRCCSSHKMSSKFEATFSKVYFRNLRMRVGVPGEWCCDVCDLYVKGSGAALRRSWIRLKMSLWFWRVQCSQSRLLPFTSAVSQFMLQTCLQRHKKYTSSQCAN